jgi:hypothetical protein
MPGGGAYSKESERGEKRRFTSGGITGPTSPQVGFRGALQSSQMISPSACHFNQHPTNINGANGAVLVARVLRCLQCWHLQFTFAQR